MTMSPAPNSSRWCPTPEQLMILEEMYRSGTRTPNASQIQQITAHLSFYGKIEGKNVFYWFQNHKARDRQKLRRKLYKQLQQQQQQQQQQHNHMMMMSNNNNINNINFLPQQNHLHFLDSPLHQQLASFGSSLTPIPQLQGGAFEDHHHNHHQAALISSYNNHHHQMMSHNWKMEIPANNDHHHHDHQRVEKENSMMRMYDRDWMMMMMLDRVGPDHPNSPTSSSLNNNSNKPLKTLELFPITSTNLKEDCTTTTTTSSKPSSTAN